MAKEQTYTDYFSPKEETYQYTFPDGKSSLTFRKLTYGDKVKLQSTMDKAEFNRKEDSMNINLGLSGHMMTAIKLAVIDWDLRRSNGDDSLQPVPFNKQNVEKLLEGLDPDVVADIEDVVKANNHWLSSGNEDEVSEEEVVERLNKVKEEHYKKK